MFNLTFDNQFTAALPGDPESGSRQRQISHALFARVMPKPAAQPQMVHYSQEVAESLGLSDLLCALVVDGECAPPWVGGFPPRRLR